mgnify:CR=1 FL=1
MQQAAPAVDANGVEKAYGETTALDGVSLSVAPGEVFALVGPNGAGKTTLLRAMNGALSPSEGRILLDGDDVADLSSRAVSRRAATVPQTTALDFEFTVREVVEMGRNPHVPRLGADPDPGAVADALDRTDTARLADRPVTAVSGGERQRVLLARAVAQDTPVLLLDEPTASLDVNHQIRTLDMVADLVGEGRTAVAAIHDLDLAARYCDALVVVADGSVLAVGPPDEVLTPETVEAAFGVRAVVDRDPVTGALRVVPLSGRETRSARAAANDDD